MNPQPKLDTTPRTARRRSEIRITNDAITVSGLHLAEPTELVVHAGGRGVQLVDNVMHGGLSVVACHDASCDCHAAAEE